ncbi:hypothetical protein BDV29DRAFT_192912 [Aspergillus leporis]|uniref:Nephrocystin 3-like N-terminal domain-containing protein n=1 Tax=Aspergillus leporis TaxID=41062 RepID=A0A5N5WTS7_9EURO|nr:hypothetical protein BDV29DRAFT_192912 [Aspergillus leporis]
MAGPGKSTIARTVADFFFKKGEADRGNAKRFISTVAKQLNTSNRQLAPGILEAIQNDPNISSKALSQQFDQLLLRPLVNLRLDEPTSTVIVIDALDECEEEDIRVLLHLLPQVQKPNDERDIRLFLQDRLGKIQKEHSLFPGWPGEDITHTLVSKTVPVFTSAATLCRFIGEKHLVPEDRLDAVLKDSASTSGSQMERMYLPILNKLPKEAEISNFAKELQDVLGVIILAGPLSVKALARLTWPFDF